MKEYVIQFLLPMLPLLMAACGDNGDNLKKDGDGQLGEPVTLNANLYTPIFTRGEVTTDNIWAARTSVAVHDADKALTYEYVTPATASSAGGSVPLSPKGSNYFYWAVTKETRTFKAWYPYSSAPWSLPLSVSVAQNQNALASDALYLQQDRLYAPPITLEYKDKTGELSFYHQLCRVVVNVTSTGTNNVVDEVKMGSDNIGLSGNITKLGSTGAGATGTTTTWDAVSGTSTVNMRKNTEYSRDAGFYGVYECIVPPQSGGSYETALFTIKATNSYGTKTYIYRDSYNFQAGYQYTYNLLLSKAGTVIIASVSVGDWGTVSFASGAADVPDDIN